MNRRFGRLVGGSFLVAAMLVPGAAAAQRERGGERAGAGIESIRDQGEDYEVAFEDDPLDAGGRDGIVPRIVVRTGGPARTLLIRVRTSFVGQMLKSVEGI